MRLLGALVPVGFLLSFALLGATLLPQGNRELDARVENFLEQHRHEWHDMNVPYSDGKILYDLIVKHNYTRALEIGTSTGHSSIWIAWALSKTGGKLITLELDRGRHETALANFKETGLDKYIDARLGDAHKLVPQLEGPFDFVFSDADKNWYKNYFIAVLPKLEVGGCFTAHNTNMRWGVQDFLDYLKTVPNMDTTFAVGSRAGISISFKASK